MGPAAGYSQGFVFIYHVPLFFFLSGCMSNLDKENNFGKFVLKKIKNIMIPFWMFSILSIIVDTFLRNTGIEYAKHLLILVLKGNIRNTFIAASLWFLSCLFVMEIIFKLLKYLKYKWVLLFLCFAMFIYSEMIAIPSFAAAPRWLYNIDSALYYIIFYAIGYLVYPYLLDFFKLDTQKKKLIFIILTVAIFTYTGLSFFYVDIAHILLGEVPLLPRFAPFIRTLIIILFNLLAAKLIENIEPFRIIGQNTLYLCGNEFITTTIFICFLAIFGFTATPVTPLSAYIYTSILLFLGMKLIIPLEKSMIQSAKGTLCNQPK